MHDRGIENECDFDRASVHSGPSCLTSAFTLPLPLLILKVDVKVFLRAQFLPPYLPSLEIVGASGGRVSECMCKTFP